MPRVHLSRGSAAALASTMLLAASLLMFEATVLRLPLERTWFFNLSPAPDAEEYFAGAMSMYREGVFELHYAGRSIPPRYPLGYSALMVPFLYAGVEPIEAPFRVNQVTGLLVLLGVFVGLWRADHVLAAGLSSVLLSTQPLFVAFSRAPLSDLSAAAFVLLSMWCFYCFVRSARPLPAALGAFFLGMGICVRIPNVLFVPVLATTIWGLPAIPFRRRCVLTVLVSVALIAGAAPLLRYNIRQFGSPLKTGYSAWLPTTSQPTTAFKMRRVPESVDHFWRIFTRSQTTYSSAAMYGEGVETNPAFLLLVPFAACFHLRRRRFWTLGLPVLLFIGIMLMWWATGRYVFPAMLVAVPLVSVVSVEVIKAAVLGRGASSAAAVSMALLLVAAVAGWPGARRHPDLVGLFETRNFYRQPRKFLLVERLERITASEKRLVLSTLNPAYVYALTSGDRIVSPLTPTLVFPPAWYTESDRAGQIAAALDEGRLVYAVVGDGGADGAGELCPAPSGYRWRPVFELGRGGGIAVLTRVRGRPRPNAGI